MKWGGEGEEMGGRGAEGEIGEGEGHITRRNIHSKDL